LFKKNLKICLFFVFWFFTSLPLKKKKKVSLERSLKISSFHFTKKKKAISGFFYKQKLYFPTQSQTGSKRKKVKTFV